MGLSIKVRNVKPLDDMMLLVEFENDIIKKYDVRQLYDEFPMYIELENNELFNHVHVDCGGYAIAWNDLLDIPEVELWEGGTEYTDG